MNQLPFYIPLVFILTTLLTIYIFFRASRNNKTVLITVLSALAIEGAVGFTGFFTAADAVPPRLLILLVLPLLFIIFLFLTRRGRSFIDGMDIKILAMIHFIRMPVELVLFWLFLHKLMPQLMTFEGRNLDIFSGLTAPLVYYFGFVKNRLGNRFLLAWNIVCLGILGFTVSMAILSTPTPFQQFGFDQPTVAVLYFPFVWLPGIVVPLVYFSHLIAIRRLLNAVRRSVPARFSPAGPAVHQC